MKNELISVIIPCFNQGKYLIQCLNSLFQQTHKDWEAIIIDDGSTENIKEYIKDYIPLDNIKLFRQENKGLPAARNKGIELSTGKYIQFLDADDYIMPDKFAVQINEIIKNEVDIAYCGYFAFNHPFENKGCTTDTKFDESKAFYEFSKRWENGLCVPIHCFLYSKYVFNEIGVFSTNLPNHEDWDLHLRISLAGFTYFHNPEMFARYRVHENSMCRNSNMNLGKSMVTAHYSQSEIIGDELRSFFKQETLKIYPNYDFSKANKLASINKIKENLMQITYVFCVRIDSAERLANLDFAISFLQNNFMTKIILVEQDHKSKLDKRYNKIKYIFEQTDLHEFHRTRLINNAVKLVDTTYFCNIDADVYFDAETHLKCLCELKNNSVVYPFSGNFYDIPQKYNKLNQLNINEIDVKEKAMINPNSYGGAVFFRTNDFVLGGMENEKFISWGNEDNERFVRFSKLGFGVKRIDGAIHHFTHPRSNNSNEKNPHYNDTVVEYNKINKLSKTELAKYIKENFTWITDYSFVDKILRKEIVTIYNEVSNILILCDQNEDYLNEFKKAYPSSNINILDVSKTLDFDSIKDNFYELIIEDDSRHLGINSKMYFENLFTTKLKSGGSYIIKSWGTGYWDIWPDGKTMPSINYEFENNEMRTHSFGIVGFVKYLVDRTSLKDICNQYGNQTNEDSDIDELKIRHGQVIIVKR